MIWQNLRVLKASPLWKKLEKSTRYDFLGFDEKKQNLMEAVRQKRIERKKAKKGGENTSDQ